MWIEQFFSERMEKNVYWFFPYNEMTKKLYDAKSKSLITKLNSASKDDKCDLKSEQEVSKLRAHAFLTKCLSNEVLEAFRLMNDGNVENMLKALLSLRPSTSEFSEREILQKLSNSRMKTTESLLSYMSRWKMFLIA
ncbi:hypothetical protein A3Q56_01598 [Intoshia linei]|uniref:Uncharacterized protein n=1 Tax=Intoshia linei TaxID=1819745 RepID=A0A177BAF1_9BILA|nr:hypothetical protein A3Q56_01598 [Intoshia linei]